MSTIRIDNITAKGVKSFMELEIKNIVGISRISDRLDLKKLYQELENTTYEPEQFSALIYRNEKPHGTIQIFKSGSIICTGTNNEDDVHLVIEQLMEKLRFLDVPIYRSYRVEIKNMVFTRDFQQTINLSKVAITFGLENVDYDPDDFPGLIYKVNDPDVTFIIFESGKIICTGSQSNENAEISFKRLEKKLKTNKIIS